MEKIYAIEMDCPTCGDRIFLLNGHCYREKEDCEKAISDFKKHKEEQFQITKKEYPNARRDKDRHLRVREICLV